MNIFFKFFFPLPPSNSSCKAYGVMRLFSYLLAKQNILQILSLTAKDFNPPLYYLLLHGWMGLFGSSEIAMRTLSFFFFLGTLYVVGMFLMEIFEFSINEILVYLLLFVLNPLLHYYAFEARMYSLFAFLVTLSFYFSCQKIVSEICPHCHPFALYPLFCNISPSRSNYLHHAD